jgi:DivIVA domain-containing protein
VELDPQTIERRDFPISRRGYDPAAVDAHLRALAAAVEQLKHAAAAPGGGWSSDSLATSAGSQVQAIVAAAEVAAAEIESEAQANAQATREQAESDAQKTRADAVAQAQAHVGAVSKATATLLSRVESLDGETGTLVDSLRAGATRLAGDLTTVETNMGELYDAAAGRRSAETTPAPAPVPVVSAVAQEAHPDSPPPPHPAGVPRSPTSSPSPQKDIPAAPPISSPATTTTTPRAPVPPISAEPLFAESPSPEENADADGARLVALNMALNGDSREDADRYLAENYEVEDRAKLLDEVYAAVEG